MPNSEKFKKVEKEINNTFLKLIIGFTFLVDSKDNLTVFTRKHFIEIYDHLLLQYGKIKNYYLEFKIRHQEYTKKK